MLCDLQPVCKTLFNVRLLLHQSSNGHIILAASLGLSYYYYKEQTLYLQKANFEGHIC